MQKLNSIDLKEIKSTLYTHGERGILDFWCQFAVDTTYGGLYGELSRIGVPNKTAAKGLVQHARYLYSFSLAYEVYKDPKYLKLATHTYNFINRYFFDSKNEGYYYKLNYDGTPLLTNKHLYAQSFAIYAFSEYALAANNFESYKKAVDLYFKIEKIGLDKDHNGYIESFDQKWNEIDQLSEYGITKKRKTMNTHIHLLEAYTSLLKAAKFFNLHKIEISNSLDNLVMLTTTKIFRSSLNSLALFFEKDWTILASPISFGHDIEVSWLIRKAIDEIIRPTNYAHYENIAKKLLDNTLKLGIESKNGYLLYEASEIDLKIIKSEPIWWTQAEAMVGFYIGYKYFKDEKYLNAFKQIFDWCLNHQFDKKHLDWFENPNQPDLNKGHVWKTPYHNLRATLTVYKSI